MSILKVSLKTRKNNSLDLTYKSTVLGSPELERVFRPRGRWPPGHRMPSEERTHRVPDPKPRRFPSRQPRRPRRSGRRVCARARASLRHRGPARTPPAGVFQNGSPEAPPRPRKVSGRPFGGVGVVAGSGGLESGAWWASRPAVCWGALPRRHCAEGRARAAPA
jgi:hypothetical protein